MASGVLLTDARPFIGAGARGTATIWWSEGFWGGGAANTTGDGIVGRITGMPPRSVPTAFCDQSMKRSAIRTIRIY